MNRLLNLSVRIIIELFDFVFKVYYSLIFKKKEGRVVGERPIEYGFVLSHLPTAKANLAILDVGPDRTSFPALLEDCNYNVTATETSNYWGRNIVNRHFPLTYDITKSKLKSSSYDAITCISVLEHIFWNSGVRLPKPLFVSRNLQHDHSMLILEKKEW